MGNGSRALALFAVALCLQSTPVFAQARAGSAPQVAPPSRALSTQRLIYVPPGSRPGLADRPGPLTGGTDGAATLYQSTLDFARCMQHTRPERLATLLEKPISSRAEELAADRLLRFSGACPGGRLSVSPRMLRGAAAEVILENFAAPAPDRVTHINTAQVSDFAAASPPVDQVRDRFSQDVQTFVECQVVLAPGLARKLITTAPGTTGADEAAKELIAATGRCGSFHTQRGPVQIAYRSYLAEALYHWTRATASNRLS